MLSCATPEGCSRKGCAVWIGAAVLSLGMLALAVLLTVAEHRGRFTSLADTAATLARPVFRHTINVDARLRSSKAFGFGMLPHGLLEVMRRQTRGISTCMAAVPTREPSVVIPLEYAPNGGIYNLRFTVDGSVVRAAFDSGSSALVVGTTACVANGHGCQPENGGYDAADKRQLMRDVVIEYGSQAVETDIVLDTLHLDGVHVEANICQGLLSKAGLRGGAAARESVRMSHDRVRVFAAKRITGSSAANVFGTAPAADGKSLIESILPRGKRRWGSVLGRHGGAWVLGPPPATCVPFMAAVASVPIRRPPSHDAQTLFYTVRLRDVLVGPDLAHMRSILRINTPALYMMVDTGCTMTYTSAIMTDMLQAAGVRGSAADTAVIALELEGPPPVYVVLDPARYARGRTSSLVMGTNVVDSILRMPGLMLGALTMAGMYVDFDIDKGRIGFSHLPTT